MSRPSLKITRHDDRPPSDDIAVQGYRASRIQRGAIMLPENASLLG